MIITSIKTNSKNQPRMSEITWIVERHNVMMAALTKHFSIKDIRHIIGNYTLGFVNIGKLDAQAFTTQEFEGNYLTCQIKYINGLTFIDFWRVESYDEGGVQYPCGWNIEHYSYVYNGDSDFSTQPKLYRDKINFFLLYDNYDIMASDPSLPIYNMRKLAQEEFVEFTCPHDWIDAVNNHPISDSSDQDEINNLFILFTSLTEHLQPGAYENTTKIFGL